MGRTSDATPQPGTDPVAWLIDRSHRLPPADLGDAVARAMGALGASRSAMYLADHDQQRLHPFGPPEGRDPIGIDETAGGQAYAWERTQPEPTDVGTRLWVPLLDGTARIGVIGVDVPEPGPDAGLVSAVERVAALAAELVITKGHYTDVVDRARRHKPMTLAAELQRSNIPPLALVTDDVAVAGILQPTYEVAGDLFDYALNPEGLHVAVVDSVGHDLESSLISHLVHGSLRNSRSRGHGLVETYAAADQALARMFPDQQFATAAFGCLDPASGTFRWVSAGHPPPLVARGGKVVGEAHVVPVVPLGLGGRDPSINEVVLEPGDALVLYTDGMTEGGARGGARFGLERFVAELDKVLDAGLPPAEVVRRVVDAVLTHAEHELHDDATLLLVQRRR